MRILQNSVHMSDVQKIDQNIVNKPVNYINQPYQPKDNFENILNDTVHKQESIQFSKHANLRLMNREISLSQEQMKRLENGVNKAKEKGIKDSLVFVDNIALVVNIKSQTVVTAMQNEKDQIFTNIDGAVIV